MVLVYRGQYAEPLDTIKVEWDDASRLRALGVAYWAMGRRPEADSAVAELTKRFGGARAYFIAQALAYRGDTNAAFMWLDQAYQHHESDVAWVRTDPLLGKLHRDPRFKAFLHKMNLPET